MNTSGIKPAFLFVLAWRTSITNVDIEALAYDLDFEQEKVWFDFKIYRKRKPTRDERHAIRDFLISIDRWETEE
ncbi:hypothetical protein [Escherichia coli]|uniref:hypothetical protein n=1 Tax=Escherichia coli TaxID=562 RepID=UPI00201A25A4|nr:hypothetical protein [Escherichia coli]